VQVSRGRAELAAMDARVPELEGHKTLAVTINLTINCFAGA